jgi:single-stranded DNA-binding protein
MIYFEGRPHTRSFEGKEGDKVYIHEVTLENFQFLDSAKGTESAAPAPATASKASTTTRRVPF